MQKPQQMRPRQQNLPFALNEVWDELSSEVRRQSAERVAQLLVAVIQAERKEGSTEHERQDWS